MRLFSALLTPVYFWPAPVRTVVHEISIVPVRSAAEMAVHHSYLGLACVDFTPSISPAARHLTEDDVGPMVARWKQCGSRITGHPVPVVPRCDLLSRSHSLRLLGVRPFAARTSPFPHHDHHPTSPRSPTNNFSLNILIR